jgi:PiT family inorganic phosphate transporter
MDFTIVILIVVVALAFDFINGFHDAANSIATVVSTRVLSPKYAVIWAACFNFLAAFFFEPHVAATIGKGVIRADGVTAGVIVCGLVGAIVWDLLTWWWGLPTSSSHALIGGFAGAAVAHAGTQSLLTPGLLRIGAFIVLAPMIGLVAGFLIMLGVAWLFRKSTPYKLDTHFRRLQLVSAAAYSLGHGLNDAQKTMGIIAILLVSTHHMVPKDSFLYMPEFHIPMWLILSCHAAIALGTLSGGWRIVKTMGMRITKLKPVGGFCAETAGALTLVGASLAGIPVSTTHTITGAIVGVGAMHRTSAVRWGVAGRIVWAWVLTGPAAAAVAWLLMTGLKFATR